MTNPCVDFQTERNKAAHNTKCASRGSFMSVGVLGCDLAGEFDSEVDLGRRRRLAAVNITMDVANVAVWYLRFHQKLHTVIRRTRVNPRLYRAPAYHRSKLVVRALAPDG